MSGGFTEKDGKRVRKGSFFFPGLQLQMEQWCERRSEIFLGGFIQGHRWANPSWKPPYYGNNIRFGGMPPSGKGVRFFSSPSHLLVSVDLE
ncbi:hypothetical protein AVEN_131231-1 [Araneus ventricosus]|uniref:Uncharacterized protein n=1 Tax=Araneus ventricosus TaxID=182803 RepID=A0A4Y2IRR6_ARAVE|nr:hypothetical protein AVEN_131231-1 [Araneus ventricosus]